MIKITKTELKDKITYYVQTLGLKNDEVATRLNKDYNADDKEKLTGLNVAALKKQLGIKGIKPKKKSLFEFVEESEEVEVCKEGNYTFEVTESI